MKEMSLTHSEPFHFMEFRYEPISIVTPATVILGRVSETNRAHELQVLAELGVRGARCCAIGEAGVEVEYQSGLSEVARNILYLPVGQLIACERSLAKRLNPDRPHGLSAVANLPGRCS